MVVSVYVERPRRKVSSSNPDRRHGGYHHHHHHHHEVGAGYNRRADLLLYSQQLREVARSKSAGPAADQNSQLATNHPQLAAKVWHLPSYVSLMFLVEMMTRSSRR